MGDGIYLPNHNFAIITCEIMNIWIFTFKLGEVEIVLGLLICKGIEIGSLLDDGRQLLKM